MSIFHRKSIRLHPEVTRQKAGSALTREPRPTLAYGSNVNLSQLKQKATPVAIPAIIHKSPGSASDSDLDPEQTYDVMGPDEAQKDRNRQI